MHKRLYKGFYRGFFLFILIFATSCDRIDDGGGNIDSGAPTIVNFDASPPMVGPNGVATLSWRVSGEPATFRIDASIGASPGVVTGTSVDVQPAQTTTYTLTAENSVGSDSATLNVTVSGDPNSPPPPPGNDTTTPSGTFGVSSAQSGPFQNDRPDGIDSADDPRVVEVAPGGTFYAQVSYDDPGGISSVQINLVNSSPDGIAGPLDPDQQFFTLGTPVSGCDLSNNPISVTCVYPVTVADDAVNISQLTDSEFAYVFRTKVTDTAGNTSDENNRGYVEVTGNNSTPPSPPENQAPTVSAGDDEEITLPDNSVNLDGSVDNDGLPEGSSLSTEWSKKSGPGEVTFGDASDVDTTATFSEAGTYTLTLTATDGEKTTSDDVTVEVNAESSNPPSDPNPPSPPGNQEPEANFAATQRDGTLSVQFNASSSDDPDGNIASYSWDFGDGSNVTPPGTIYTKTYSQAGNYTVALTVTDNDGATDTETKDITVNPVDSGVEAPVITSFTVTPNPAAPNQDVTLAWELAGGEATSLVTVDTENGADRDVTGETSTVVNVPTSRTFRLIAENSGGTAIAEATLEVSSATVLPPNDILDANDDAVNEEGPDISVDIFENDSYPVQGYTFPEITISAQPAAGQGQVIVDGTDVLYVSGGFVGATTFEYTLSITNQVTGEVLTDSATVAVTVTQE